MLATTGHMKTSQWFAVMLLLIALLALAVVAFPNTCKRAFGSGESSVETYVGRAI